MKTGVNNGEGTPGAGQAPEPTDRNLPDDGGHAKGADAPEGDGTRQGEGDAVKSPGKDGDDKRIVDAERLNKLIADSNKLKELEASTQHTSTELDRMKQGLAQLAGVSDAAQEDGIAKLSKQYNVQEDFLRDLMSAVSQTFEEKTKEQLKPYQQQQAQLALKQEFEQLYEDHPEARDMSAEEREEFQKLAAKPEYAKIPLTNIYRIMNFDKRPAVGYSAEGAARRGGRGFGSGEPDFSKIGDMSPKEFEEFSNKMAKGEL